MSTGFRDGKRGWRRWQRPSLCKYCAGIVASAKRTSLTFRPTRVEPSTRGLAPPEETTMRPALGIAPLALLAVCACSVDQEEPELGDIDIVAFNGLTPEALVNNGDAL